MKIKNAIKKVLTTYIPLTRISSSVGICETLLEDYATGKLEIGNMKLDHALSLFDYYTKNKDEVDRYHATIKLNEVTKDWMLEAIKILGQCQDIDEAMLSATIDYQEYLNEFSDLEEFFLFALNDDGFLRDIDYFENKVVAKSHGFYRVEEINKWMLLDY